MFTAVYVYFKTFFKDCLIKWCLFTLFMINNRGCTPAAVIQVFQVYKQCKRNNKMKCKNYYVNGFSGQIWNQSVPSPHFKSEGICHHPLVNKEKSAISEPQLKTMQGWVKHSRVEEQNNSAEPDLSQRSATFPSSLLSVDVWSGWNQWSGDGQSDKEKDKTPSQVFTLLQSSTIEAGI